MAIERTFSIIKPNAVAKNTAICWVQPTRTTRWQVLCAPTMQTASPRTAPTVPTLLNLLRAKSRSSSLKAKCARALANNFVNAACKRGIPAPDFVQCNAPDEQTAYRGVSFQPTKGHNV